MKILLIAYYYPPINSGGTMRPVKMGKYLPRFCHEVTVLTQTYGKSSITEGNPRVMRFYDLSHNKDRTGIGKKLQWLGFRLFTEMLNRFGRSHSIYTWWKRKVIRNSKRIIGQVEPDVIIATYPPVETLEIGLFLSKTYHIPFVADFRDGLIFEPIETGRMNRYRCIRERYETIEAEAVAGAAAVTTIAQPIADYYRDTFHPPRVEVISNAFDPEDLDNLPPVQLEGSCFNIVFTGRFGLSDKANRVDFFFDAVRMLVEDNKTLEEKLKVHLVGEYRKGELKELQDLIEVGVIKLHGFVERSRSLAFQRAADLLLIITLPDRTSSTSAKIFEYLYAGKPILALTYKTVLEEIIHETKTGWTVHPQEPEAIAQMLSKIISDVDFYGSIHPDRNAIEKYSVKTQMEKLDRLLKKIKAK
jgi:glycosyltransferase involved in cell wall biosynthesis